MSTPIEEFLSIAFEKNRINAIIKAVGAKNVFLQCDRETNVTNIVIPAKKVNRNCKKVVLTAHYDIVANSFAFNDNTSGMATLIYLFKNELLPPFVEFVFTDKEEVGYIGATHYVSQNIGKIKYNINVDIVGIPDTIYYTLYDIDKKLALPKKYYNKCEIESLPFNDSEAFSNVGIPSIIVMSGPKLDDPQLEFVPTIFNYQHCRQYDQQKEDIMFISDKQLQTVVDFILNMIEDNR